MPCPLHLQYLTLFSFIPDVSPPLPPPPRNPEWSQTRHPEWLVLGDLAIHLSHLGGVFICGMREHASHCLAWLHPGAGPPAGIHL